MLAIARETDGGPATPRPRELCAQGGGAAQEAHEVVQLRTRDAERAEDAVGGVETDAKIDEVALLQGSRAAPGQIPEEGEHRIVERRPLCPALRQWHHRRLRAAHDPRERDAEEHRRARPDPLDLRRLGSAKEAPS